MASHAYIPKAERFSQWFPDFLKKELAPYPGRGLKVARIVISATLTMILIVTFRIPGGSIATLVAFLLSRENLVSTVRSAISRMTAFFIGGLFIPIGAQLLASTPETHFIWVSCTLFIIFFLVRCLANYSAAIGLALIVSNVLSIWYLPGPAERNIENTLWLIAAVNIGAVVTLCVEVVFHHLQGRDDLIEGIDTRLALIEDLMASYADGRPVSNATQSGLAQFAIVGGGSLRSDVARGNYEDSYRMRMSTLVSLVARSIDFAAALANGYPSLPDRFKDRTAAIQRSVADIRHCLTTHGEPGETTIEPRPSPETPLLSEIEAMVSMMPSTFSEENAVNPLLKPIEDAPETSRIFIVDAFSNPEHLRYVLGGVLAALLCYILYSVLDWPGLSTSVTTCVLTALTTIGSSRQKQTLRITGAVLGGIIAGLGSQIFILPYIDSIAGFTVLVATMTAVAGWIATSSSRLSYAGVQFAFAFYLVHLSGFAMQTHLTTARDRVLGILLGVTMMWLVFHRLFPRSAGDEMVRTFVTNLRVLAELISSSASADDRAAILKIRRQRDQIYRRFGEVNAQSDAVPFETGPERAGDMAARDRIRRWQASVRSFYLLQTPLLRFRILADDRSRSRSFTAFEDDFRFECSRILLHIAESIDNQLATRTHKLEPVTSLVSRIDSSATRIESEFSERERALMRLTRRVAQLVDRLQVEVATKGLYEDPQTSHQFPGR